jgi:hypothetical protein
VIPCIRFLILLEAGWGRIKDEINDSPQADDRLLHHLRFGDGREYLCDFKITPIK